MRKFHFIKKDCLVSISSMASKFRSVIFRFKGTFLLLIFKSKRCLSHFSFSPYIKNKGWNFQEFWQKIKCIPLNEICGTQLEHTAFFLTVFFYIYIPRWAILLLLILLNLHEKAQVQLQASTSMCVILNCFIMFNA